MAEEKQYARVLAEEIRPGMRVARSRTHDFREVKSTSAGEASMWINYVEGGRDRPRFDAKWWMEMSA